MYNIVIKHHARLLKSALSELDGDIECLAESGFDLSVWRQLLNELSGEDPTIEESSIERLDDISDRFWDELHSQHHSLISHSIRLGFTITMHIEALLALLSENPLTCIERLDEIIIMVDCPILGTEIYNLVELVQKNNRSELQRVDFPEVKLLQVPDIKYPVKRFEIGDIKDWDNILNMNEPCIIENVITDWKAYKQWQDLNELMNTMGPDRLIPVELGSKYTDTDWNVELMTVETFILDHLASETDVQGYMAQHDLFHQMPHLLNDIDIPEYLKDKSTSINAWLGPSGTRSPLHSDQYDNLFAQAVGYKYFWLCSPSESYSVYPYSADDLMENTSRVDVETPDLQRYPRFARVKYCEALVKPGDMMFIPAGWWHFVKSLSVSFSVSFWFNK